MHELIGRLAANAGIDTAVAEKTEKTAGVVLNFLRSEGPSDPVEAPIARIGSAETAITASCKSAGLTRLMGGGVMAAGTRSISLGSGMTDIRNVARELERTGWERSSPARQG